MKTLNRVFGICFAAIILTCCVMPKQGRLDGGIIQCISVAWDGSAGNTDSHIGNQTAGRTITSDGRYVVFDSKADNLVIRHTNGRSDVFLYDRQTGVTSLMSVNSNGEPANWSSQDASISDDGRFVAVISYATNLTPEDKNGAEYQDAFVHDRVSGETELVSIASDGTQANTYTGMVSISADGRYVSFMTPADNVVDGDTNASKDVFVHDRLTGVTSLVSVSSAGIHASADASYSALSADGRFIAFVSNSDNLVDGDTNGAYDIFVHDRILGETARVSVASDGRQGNDHSGFDYPSISADGRFVAFDSAASNLVAGDTNRYRDIFVHDRTTGETTRISISSTGEQGNDHAYTPSISRNGRYIAFYSEASNLVDGDVDGFFDVFLHDQRSGETIRISVASDGMQGNGDSFMPSISEDGRYIGFTSYAANFVAGDPYNFSDVFVLDRGEPDPDAGDG